jgi:ubiquinone/menaquinone biosynthesis C-methylase UbiE
LTFIECFECKNEIEVRNGILCFVNAQFTELDNIDYDKFYSVSSESSQKIFNEVKSHLLGRLKDHYSTTLEIGAGTGGYTEGFLYNTHVDDAIVTDISEKMLTVCRNKLTNKVLKAKNIIFATYSTQEEILCENCYELVYGTFVLHHVFNYKAALLKIHKGLIKEGVCFFIEPNFRFHKALILTMIDVLRDLLIELDGVMSHQLTCFSNWIYEVYFNLKYVGDAEILEDREDKHMFIPEDLQNVGLECGFNRVEILNWGVRDYGDSALAGYLPQIGCSEEFQTKVLNIYKSYNKKYFDLLSAGDLCTANIYIFEK